MKREFKKLGLTYQPYKNMSCIHHPHYDLFECKEDNTKIGYSVACILASDSDSIKLIRKWVKRHNKEVSK